MTNFFEQLADRQMNGAAKAKERRNERTAQRRADKMRAPSPLEKKMQEQAELSKLYRAWKRGVKESILQRHKSDFKELMRIIWNLDWNEVDKVVDYVRTARWLHEEDEDTRFVTLNYIDASISRARVRNGMPCMDDGIPFTGEPDSPEVMCRKILFGY